MNPIKTVKPVKQRLASRLGCGRSMSLLGLCAALFFTAPLTAARAATDFAYPITPQALVNGTYWLEGAREDFTPHNGGLMVNCGVIITDDSVVVIDTGPSRAFGDQWRAKIEQLSAGKPIVLVINTHDHPDHVLGNQSFARAPLSPQILAASDATVRGLSDHAADFTANLYRMVGAAMQGTEPVLPATILVSVEHPEVVQTIGGHRLRFLLLPGHTAGDLAVFDETTGVLFTGDLAFYQRAATTPHADLARWQESLHRLQRLPFRWLVPGHGPATRDAAPLEQTRDWLQWLDQTLRQSAAAGLTQTEVMRLPLPDRFSGIALAREEFLRSGVHLYPALERAALPPAATLVPGPR